MNTKSGCGRLDLSALQGGPARPAWPVDAEARDETRSWRPAELERPDLAWVLEPRPC